eukprot:92808-Pelagomonas_calceolata.AAC.4
MHTHARTHTVKTAKRTHSKNCTDDANVLVARLITSFDDLLKHTAALHTGHKPIRIHPLRWRAVCGAASKRCIANGVITLDNAIEEAHIVVHAYLQGAAWCIALLKCGALYLYIVLGKCDEKR